MVWPPGFSRDPALWTDDPWYDPERDTVEHMYQGKKGEPTEQLEVLDYDLKINVDVEMNTRTMDFLERQAEGDKPFLVYHNYSLMHLPVHPRDEYKGTSGHGDWADCLLQLDGDFGMILDKLDEFRLA